MNLHRRLCGDSGAAAVEFALVLPILVLLIMGISEFSRAYNAKEVLQHAVRDGARELALGETPATVQQVVKDRVEPMLDDQLVTVPLPAECPDNPAVTDAAEVTATYDLTYNIPLFSSGTWTLSATGAMRCNG